MARRAWDYFAGMTKRPIQEVYYSPCCHGIRAWVCVYIKTDQDMKHWQGETVNWNIEFISCDYLKRKDFERRQHPSQKDA